MFIAALSVTTHKLETTQMSINWWMDKQIVTNPYNRIVLNSKQEWAIYACNDTDKSQNNGFITPENAN